MASSPRFVVSEQFWPVCWFDLIVVLNGQLAGYLVSSLISSNRPWKKRNILGS